LILTLTWDFHNTLTRCDAWLDLEIRTLARDALCYISEHAPDRCARNLMAGPDAAAWLDEADARYADLRAAARSSGLEVTALTAVNQIVNEEFGVGAPHDLIEEAVAALMRGCLADVAPIPGVEAALAAVNGARPMAVVSSAAYPQFVAWALDKLGLHRYFPVVITSAESGYYKTDPRIYLAAVAALQQIDPTIIPAQVAHIGDSLRFDVAGAQAAGLRTIWYNPDGHGALGRNASPGTVPDVEIAHMSELPDAVAVIESNSGSL
jgi:FMN phosphatase YigB (HAD superfamily)